MNSGQSVKSPAYDGCSKSRLRFEWNLRHNVHHLTDELSCFTESAERSHFLPSKLLSG